MSRQDAQREPKYDCRQMVEGPGDQTIAELPPVVRLRVASVRLPASHPRASGGPCDVLAYAIRHPDGVILVDTGVGVGNRWIDAAYAPVVVDVIEALNAVGIDERDVAAVVNTHLHFDHCGQNARFSGIPVYVQAAELEATTDPMFTVAEWADIPLADRRVVDGDATIADGVTLLATPGHTPGHQSVALESAEGAAVIVGQCAYCAREFDADEVSLSEMHDDTWHESGLVSLKRLRSLRPLAAYFSHDPTTWRALGS